MPSKKDMDDYIEGMPGTLYGELGLKHQRQLSGQTDRYDPPKPISDPIPPYFEKHFKPKPLKKKWEPDFNMYWFWPSFLVICIYMLSIDEHWFISLFAGLIGAIMISALWRVIVVGLVLAIIYFAAKFFLI